jgi:Ca2+-binding RTX toxin-like protein
MNGSRGPVASAEIDLESRTMLYGRTGRRTSLVVAGFETADLHARSVRMAGSAGQDTLTASTCDVDADGHAGNDRLAVTPDFPCRRGTQRHIAGGAGDDRLFGSPSSDVLVGGRGTDRATGGAGRDRCDAEQERSCELPARLTGMRGRDR